MMTNANPLSDLAISPGEFLEETLEDIGLGQSELAKRMGRPAQAINEIIKGVKSITPDTSIQLEQVLGVPAHIWTALESEYRLVLARNREEESISAECSMVSLFPYAEIAKLGLVKKTRVAKEKVRNLRSFFGVSSLENIREVKQYSAAFRQDSRKELGQESLVSWLRAGSLLAEKQLCDSYSKERLMDSLPEIRALTNLESPQEFFPKLECLLKASGVSLVVIPHFKKTYTTGATFWNSKDQAVVMMSLRGSWADIFWFSLFHEIGHIVLHDKRRTFLEIGEPNPKYANQEAEADKFAQEQLIPKAELRKFVSSGDFSQNSIASFSKGIGVSAGIVTGRLQHEKLVHYSNNFGRRRYRWEQL